MTTVWRYIAQRALTGEFLDFDLPLTRDELSWSLSGPGSLRGSIAPEYGRLRASDGSPLLDEWSTLLYAEANGEIRWGGVLVSSTFSGGQWQIEAAGMLTYPHGIPYMGSYTKAQVDPFDAVREIWRHVQSFAGGDLGMTVSDGSTPVLLGTLAQNAYTEVQISGFWQPESGVDPALIVPSQSAKLRNSMDTNDTSLTMQSLGGFDTISTPYMVTIGSERLWVTSRSGTTLSGLTRGYQGTKIAKHSGGSVVTHTGTPTRLHPPEPAQPYSLQWYESPDCGDELDNLAQETPFDYVEAHEWQSDGTISHAVQLGYPRLGTRRTDLAFVMGDNVTGLVAPTRDGSTYANEVIGFGAGEGSAALRVQVPETLDTRLRRPVVYSDKSVKTITRLNALARTQLTRYTQLTEITSIDVTDHANARLGSWQLGDDILVSADLPWLGRVDIWSRVVGWSLLSDTRATLTLKRSDSFYYGRPPQQ